jgi:hypothetical protein
VKPRIEEVSAGEVIYRALRGGLIVTRIRRHWIVAVLAAAIGASYGGCGGPASGAPRWKQSFDEIERQVTGKTEAEVEQILGKPDTREARLVDDDVWIWWGFTFLDGEQYAPEVRGQVVHLEITFDRPAGTAGQELPHAAWRVAGPYSVNFSRRLPRG